MRTRNVLVFLLGLLPVACILPSPSAFAQNLKPSPYKCQYYSSDPADPVSSGLRGILECYAGGFIALAEEIPTDKYTPQHLLGESVGHNVGHVATISSYACAKILGVASPKPRRKIVDDTDKDGMLEWLKSSMEFCKEAFSTLSDDRLGESIPWNFDPSSIRETGPRVTRFGAASWVTNVLIERYAAFAGYFQLHGSLSPFASVPSIRAVQK
jgi:hypothetical protein